MLISFPFLMSQVTEDNTDSIQLAFSGQYPVTSYLEWHNGQHLIAPQENSVFLEVRAIADGTVIHAVPADAAPSTGKKHPQNYAAFGEGPEWTDKGFVILKHTTEIGAEGNTPTTLTFYSVYAHMKELATGIAKDKKVYRKDILGRPGRIYDRTGHIHFEICLDDDNIKKLLGKDPNEWPPQEATPTKDGRTDAVFGSIYVCLPAGTPVQTAKPTCHIRATTAVQTLGTAQWVQINYANNATPGSATMTSFKTDGSVIGTPRTDPDAEYDLYKEANTRHNSLNNTDKATSSPSGWYELLRFGRNLGRSATDKDPLPANAAHWRKIVTPTGELWADLNADGTYKFSDGDFPAIMGWNCFGDDEKPQDQRCDSVKLKRLLISDIKDMDKRVDALQDPLFLFRQTRIDSIATKLRKAICKFPSEFDQDTMDARYGHIQEEEYFKSDVSGKNWKALSEHIKALTVTGLPDEYKNAQWHLHPLAFIEQMRKCGWLSKNELMQCIPSDAVRAGQWKDAHGDKHPGVFWEGVSVSKANLESGVFANHRIPLNRAMRKYGISTPLRKASFLGNVIQESTWMSALAEGGGNTYWYAPWFGRGFLQLTHPSNYFAYWEWRGRTIDATLTQSILAVAAKEAAKKPKERSLTALADTNFTGVTQEIKDWRDNVAGGPNPVVTTPEKLTTPSDSAGFYWISIMIRHSDAAHELKRVNAATVDTHGNATGYKVYYRSPTFWRVSASVNLPSALDRNDYSGINGFESRCCAYGTALATLTEMRFPGPNDTTLEYPEGYTPRRDK